MMHKVNLNSTRTLILFVIIITAIIYAKTIGFSFVNWDDDENIRTQTEYKELSIKNFKYHFEKTRYKALAIWSFMFDAKLFGNKPFGFHLHNLVLHLLNVFLVFLLIKKISQKDFIALVGTAFFALHPVFVEPVAWITGRKDLFFVLYTLLTAIIYIKYIQNEYKLYYLLLAVIFAYLASLAKIQAFMIPLILFLIDWFFKRKLTPESIIDKFIIWVLFLDKWVIAMFLFVLLVLIKAVRFLYDKRKFSKEVFVFWYLIVFGYLISMFSFMLFRNKSFLYIPPILIMSVYFVVMIIAIKKREIIIEKIRQWNKISLLLVAPVIIFALEVTFKVLTSERFWSSFEFNYWLVQKGNPYYFEWGERFILAPVSFVYYLSRFLLISPQNPMFPYPMRGEDGSLPGSLTTYAIVIYLALMLALVLFLIFFRKNRMAIFGTLWFLGAIGVVMHIIPIEGRVLAADRYAYPAYTGLFLISAQLVEYFLQKFNKKIVYSIISGVFIVFCVITFINLDTWKNSKTLWKKALKVRPDNHYAMYSLSLAWFEEDKNPQRALQYIDKAISLKEDFQYYNNRAKIRHALQDFSGAYQDLNKSIALSKNNFAAYNNRGALLQQFGKYKEALNDFNKALALKPDFAEAKENRNKILRLVVLDSILKNDIPVPDNEKQEMKIFIERTSQLLINNHDYDLAVYYLEKGIKFDPYYQAFHEKLAVMYQLRKQYRFALDAYNRGLNYIPENPSLLFGRGILFLETGDTLSACIDLKKSEALGFSDASNFINTLCK